MPSSRRPAGRRPTSARLAHHQGDEPVVHGERRQGLVAHFFAPREVDVPGVVDPERREANRLLPSAMKK
jgi:hypothetical protein